MCKVDFIFYQSPLFIFRIFLKIKPKLQPLLYHINRYTNISIIRKYRQNMASVLYSNKCTVLLYRINQYRDLIQYCHKT